MHERACAMVFMWNLETTSATCFSPSTKRNPVSQAQVSRLVADAITLSLSPVFISGSSCVFALLFKIYVTK